MGGLGGIFVSTNFGTAGFPADSQIFLRANPVNRWLMFFVLPHVWTLPAGGLGSGRGEQWVVGAGFLTGSTACISQGQAVFCKMSCMSGRDRPT